MTTAKKRDTKLRALYDERSKLLSKRRLTREDSGRITHLEAEIDALEMAEYEPIRAAHQAEFEALENEVFRLHWEILALRKRETTAR